MIFSRSELLSISNEKLLQFCDQSFYIGSGAGGQHRNKTQSGVRLVFKPLGITITHCTSRHREENRLHALKQLRFEIALTYRVEEIETPSFPPPSMHNPKYFLFVAALLDVLSLHEFDIKKAALSWGISTSKLHKIIESDARLIRYLSELKSRKSTKIEL